MKYIWEESDVVGGKVCNNKCDGSRLIGWRPDPCNPNIYMLISLSDGLVMKSGTKKEIAQYLTDNGFYPRQYRSNLVKWSQFTLIIKGIHNGI